MTTELILVTMAGMNELKEIENSNEISFLVSLLLDIKYVVINT